MGESIEQELGSLETVGRVSVSGRRPVHADFGFAAMKRDEQDQADPPPRDFAHELDAARERLKSQVAPE